LQPAAEGSWFYYAPNKVAPVIFAVAFLISGVWHLYQNMYVPSFRRLPHFFQRLTMG
jgi:hypothetical protein